MNITVEIEEKDFNQHCCYELEMLNKRIALETNYELNYNLGYLNNIREYYKLKKRNLTGHLTKKEVIEMIVEYELKRENKNIVEERERLFGNFLELKNNKYFQKYIIGNL